MRPPCLPLSPVPQAQVHRLPVRATVEPGYLRPRLPACAPEQGEGLEAVLADVRAHILPGITHWQSPSFFAWCAQGPCEQQGWRQRQGQGQGLCR